MPKHRGSLLRLTHLAASRVEFAVRAHRTEEDNLIVAVVVEVDG